MRTLGNRRKPRFCQIAAVLLGGLLVAGAAAACEVPADDSASPLRRLITRVKHLPETEAWQKALPEGTTAQFVVLLDSPQKIDSRCYWPIEVRAGATLWKRFLVTADGSRVLER